MPKFSPPKNVFETIMPISFSPIVAVHLVGRDDFHADDWIKSVKKFDTFDKILMKCRFLGGK